MKKRKEVAALVLALMIFISMLYSLPLVSAVYTVEEHYMPPELDDSEAICALKTRTDGYFYRPNLAIDLLKIEMLFDNSNLAGDQAGGTSPYSSISYPDRSVDMVDVSFISDKFMCTEGLSGWDYMADVVPDRSIDMIDVSLAIDNFMNSGEYPLPTNLTGVTVTFNIGGQKSPDSNGFVTIPSGATSFTVKRNSTPIGAMVIFYGPRELPIAYSTTFDFTVPAYTGGDMGKEVWYYILARLYVPSELSGQNFYFVATADYSVQNVKMNGYSKTGSGSSVNIDLGKLGGGYNLLEFEFVDVSGGGSLSFHVATAASQYAWLSRFRIYVPNYSNNEYKYNVGTSSNLTHDDYYFLSGYADDYINDVYWGGLKMRDWQWNCTPYDTIYTWGYGFQYPIAWPSHGVQPLNLTFGEIWDGGLLDFQVISWSFQRDRLGPPKFYASANLSEGKYSIFPWDYDPEPYCNVTEAEFFGGSRWSSEESPEISNKYFETRLRINATSEDEFHDYLDVSAEVGLGLGWAEWALGPGTQADDIGILVNLTCVNLHSNFFSESYPWDLILYNTTLDIYSFSALNITGVEFYDKAKA